MSSIVSALQEAHAHQSSANSDLPQSTALGVVPAHPHPSAGLWRSALLLMICVLCIGVLAALFLLYAHIARIEESMTLQEQTQQRITQQMAQQLERLSVLSLNQQDMLYHVQQQLASQGIVPENTQLQQPAHAVATTNRTTVAAPHSQGVVANQQTHNSGETHAITLTPESTAAALPEAYQALHSALPWSQAPERLQRLLDPSTIAGHLFDKSNPDASFIIIGGQVLQAGSLLGRAETDAEPSAGARILRIEQQTAYVTYQQQTYFFTINLDS